jgi:S-adenosylmethionine:tRNA ribosyltransferase-isomerase
MKLDDFDFNLPEELIALHPTTNRDESRLMIVNRETEEIKIDLFSNIHKLFNDNDLILLNNSKVINARLRLKRETGGKIEILLLEHSSDFTQWKGICNRTKKVNIGETLFGDDNIQANIIDKINGKITLKFNKVIDYEKLSETGEIPLPPYIANRRNTLKNDKERYQTVYAKIPGSLAAPTAGLHFTEDVLDNLKNKNVKIDYITLHVSSGTFLPIKSENIEEHNMHSEFYSINTDVANIINEYLNNNQKRITCVGTTTIRTLENELKINNNKVKNGSFSTNIFIYPGFEFLGTDRLITNFHTPKSTPLLLVSAFTGYELLKKAYNIAIKEKIRFYSYGDSMIIL